MAILTNPQTGIRYDSVSLKPLDRFVVTQGEDLTHPSAFSVEWRALQGNPIIDGFIPGERWWKIVYTELPTYDFRYATTDTWAAYPGEEPEAEGYPAGEWKAARTATLRSNEELYAIIDSQKKAANNTIYPDGDDPSRRALVEDARERKAAGTAGVIEMAILEEHESRIMQMKQNEQHAINLKAAASSGNGFDPTSGWVYGVAVPQQE
jgi:hypothetical protein